MNLFTVILTTVGGAALLAAALYGLSVRRTVSRLDEMLDQALTQRFTERTYDETTLSRLEHKLARFLSVSRTTAGAVQEERAKVQALIGDISHQTKTPLSNILLYAQLLGEEKLPESARPLVEQIGGQSEKLQFLIGSLVKTSRLESGAVQVRPATNSVAELLCALEKQYRAAADAKGVSLTVAPAELTACFDPRWTAEAVGNLIDNAVKYTPPGGSVRVEARDYPMFCRISVADNGPGIPEAEHAEVFSRFYRGRDASAEGVGLGLYLARQIITAEGGYIKLASATGRGSDFSVFLSRDGVQL